MLDCDTTHPPQGPEALWHCAVDAAELADGIRELVNRLAHAAGDGEFELKYLFAALERLLGLLCEMLHEQLCAGLLGPAAAAHRAEEGQP